VREVAIQQGCAKFYITNVHFWKALERVDYTDAGRWIEEPLKHDRIAVPVHIDDSWILVGIENLQCYSKERGADFFFGGAITLEESQMRNISERLLDFVFGRPVQGDGDVPALWHTTTYCPCRLQSAAI
jgi:hypothetical protein